MRAAPVAAVLLSFAGLSLAQTPPALQGVTPDTVEVPERNLHLTAIAEPDITMSAPASPSPYAIFVTVSYLISTTGDVQDAVAINGPAAYREPAADGVRHWKYRPYTVNGEPRTVKSLVVIHFQNGVGKRIEPPPPPVAGVQGGIVAGVGSSPVVVKQAAPKPTGAVRISSSTAAGMIVSRPDPIYPLDAIAAHIQGTVVMHAILSKEGTVEKLTVISGPPMLATAALDAVRQWRYRPYLLNGDPVEVETVINVNFTISNKPPTSDSTLPQ